MATGRCTFEVVRRIPQRSPVRSEKRKLRMVGKGTIIPDKDEEEIGLPARRYLSQKHTFLLLVDDLERDRAKDKQEVYQRYRSALDAMLGPHKHRASVHFLVNMLEAYFFADPEAVNAVLGTGLTDCAGDVEMIRHPKNDLKHLVQGYDEIEHGHQILARLDAARVLSRPDTCASLRTLFAWCWKALGEPFTDLYQLTHGQYDAVTRPQLDHW
jgi:hypothetical protein